MGGQLGTMPAPHGASFANICPYASGAQAAQGVAVPTVMPQTATNPVIVPTAPSNFASGFAPAAGVGTGTTLFTPAQAGNWLTAPSITEAIPTGPNLWGAVGDFTPGVQGFAMNPNTIDPTLLKEYNDWRTAAKYDDYLSMRKYYGWKCYSNGNVDDWGSYGKWKNIWKKENASQFKSEYEKWKKSCNPNDIGTGFSLWKEWCGWKAVKKQLQDRFKLKGDRKVDRKYRKYKRWCEKAIKDLQIFLEYYKYLRWKAHAQENKYNCSDNKLFSNWLNNHWGNCRSPSQVQEYYQRWSRNYYNRDYAEDFASWSDWHDWKHSGDYYDHSNSHHADWYVQA